MGTRHLIIVYYKGQYFIAQYGQWDGYPSGQGRDMLEFARDPEMIAKLQAALDADILYRPSREEFEEWNRKADEMEELMEQKQRIAQLALEAEFRAECERDPQLLADHRDYMKPTFEDEIPDDERFKRYRQKVGALRDAVSNKHAVAEDGIFPLVGQDPYDIFCPSISRNTSAKILILVAEATEPVPVVRDLEFITDSVFCEWAWVLDLDLRVIECWRGGNRGLPENSTRFDHLQAIQSGSGSRPALVASFPLDDLPQDEDTFVKQCGEVVND